MSTACLDAGLREVERPADDEGWRTVDTPPSKLKAAREQEDQEDWDFWLNAWGEG